MPTHRHNLATIALGSLSRWPMTRWFICYPGNPRAVPWLVATRAAESLIGAFSPLHKP